MKTNVEKRNRRIKELDDYLARTGRLTNDEYLSFLHEARKNYLIQLVTLSVQGKHKGSIACLTAVDRIHAIISSIEGDTSASHLELVVNGIKLRELNFGQGDGSNNGTSDS